MDALIVSFDKVKHWTELALVTRTGLFVVFFGFVAALSGLAMRELFLRKRAAAAAPAAARPTPRKKCKLDREMRLLLLDKVSGSDFAHMHQCIRCKKGSHS
jgi:hypothetical protein